MDAVKLNNKTIEVYDDVSLDLKMGEWTRFSDGWTWFPCMRTMKNIEEAEMRTLLEFLDKLRGE